MTSRAIEKLSYYAEYSIALIMVLLPFHAFITTWIGSNTGHLDLVRIWKEIIIFSLIPLAITISYRNKALYAWLKKNWLPRLIFMYLVVHIALGIYALLLGQVNSVALIFALIINLRFFGFFIIVLILSTQTNFLRRNYKKIILAPAIVIVTFGLMQRLVLPYDFLKHFGYGENTIAPFQTIDRKLSYLRIQSFLRGSNSLGAYMILVIISFFEFMRRKLLLIWFVAGFLVLFFTYSRSAWIGIISAFIAYGFMSVTNSKKRRQLLTLVIIMGIFTSFLVVILRNNSIVQNTFFHTDNTSISSESSNTGRARAIKTGLSDVVNNPLGAGPGTAGPASVRNNHDARISENYYIQITQEVGLIGALLFLLIICIVGINLWKTKTDILCRVLLASLIGISFVNLLSHAWTDDTLSLLWWGLAGIAYSTAILNKKIIRHEI